MFYLGVGLPIYYIGPYKAVSGWAGSWGVNNFAAIPLAVAGWFHTFKLVKEADTPSMAGFGQADSISIVPNDDIDFSSPMSMSGGGQQTNHGVATPGYSFGEDGFATPASVAPSSIESGSIGNPYGFK